MRSGIAKSCLKSGIILLASLSLLPRLGGSVPYALAASDAGSQYAVEGVALGSRTLKSSDDYRQYQCAPSDQFTGYTWCTKKRTDREPRGKFDVSNSILHDRDGTLVYINRFQAPAYRTGTEVE